MTTATPGTHERPVTVIQPARAWRFLDLRELWEYRELLYFLTWRDIKVRYKQTAIGVLWAVLQPLAMMIVFTLFLGRLAGVPSDGVPYPLFAFAGLLVWTVFSKTIAESTNSLVTDQRLITRVYFPRILVPSATTLGALADFVVASVLLAGLMAYYGYVPTWTVALVPLFVVLMVVAALGMGFWLSALNIEYRDVRYALPFLTQFLLFLTPVVYPASIVPEKWRILYALNPMAAAVEGFRWSVLGVGEGLTTSMAISALVAIAVFVSGIYWFRNRERRFADLVGSGGR